MNVSNLMVNAHIGDDRITMTGPRGEITDYIFSVEDLSKLKQVEQDGAIKEAAMRGRTFVEELVGERSEQDGHYESPW